MAKVLIVDDERSMRITLQKFLEDTGYEAQVAEEAETALEMLSAEDYDVVVSDIIMPRVTGIALLRSIKEASPHVQVILMTGEPNYETSSEAVRLRAFDYIAKPIRKSTLSPNRREGS